jgi:hypothetical protein
LNNTDAGINRFDIGIDRISGSYILISRKIQRDKAGKSADANRYLATEARIGEVEVGEQGEPLKPTCREAVLAKTIYAKV